MEVGATGGEVIGVADAVVGEAALPDRKAKGEAMGESALDEADGSFKRGGLGS